MPTTKELWMEWKEIWPMPWRVSDTTPSDVMLNEALSDRAVKYMQFVLDKAEEASKDNAAVIVDPQNDKQALIFIENHF